MDYLDPSIPVLVRTARSILDWSQVDLAKHSGVAFNTIGRLERCETSGRAKTIHKLIKTFEDAGLTFQIDGVSFGLSINGDLAIRMRQQVREQQLSEGGSLPTSGNQDVVPKTRVRKRRINLDGASADEVPSVRTPRRRVIKVRGK